MFYVINTCLYREKADDGSVNITVQPSAKMSFYKVVAEEEVSGKEVKLSDTLIMALQLDNQFNGRCVCACVKASFWQKEKCP